MEQLLDNYERFHNELEADLYLLQMMLQLDRQEPLGDTIELGAVLKYLRGCADFVNDETIDMRLEHAELRFRQLSYLDWMIKSLPIQEREIINGFICYDENWEDVARRLYISRATYYRLRQKAIATLEQKVERDPVFADLFQDENI